MITILGISNPMTNNGSYFSRNYSSERSSQITEVHLRDFYATTSSFLVYPETL